MKYKILITMMLLIALIVACAPAIDDTDEVAEERQPLDIDVEDDVKVDVKEEDQSETAAEKTEVNETVISETSVNETIKETEELPAENSSEPSAQTEETDAVLIAGTTSRYYEWDKELFEKSFDEGKSILLVFSTNTYPASERQEEFVKKGFEKLNIPRLIGFRVPFNDERMTEEHEKLAIEYGVGTIMTKAMIKNKSLVYKDTELWDEQDFIRKATQFS